MRNKKWKSNFQWQFWAMMDENTRASICMEVQFGCTGFGNICNAQENVTPFCFDQFHFLLVIFTGSLCKFFKLLFFKPWNILVSNCFTSLWKVFMGMGYRNMMRYDNVRCPCPQCVCEYSFSDGIQYVFEHGTLLMRLIAELFRCGSSSDFINSFKTLLLWF